MRKRFFITLFVLVSIICGNSVDAQNNIAFVNTIDIIKGIIAGFGANILTESTMIQLDQIGKVFGQ